MNKPLSAQERAEKFFEWRSDLPICKHMEDGICKQCEENYLAAEIQAAVDEAMVEAFEGEDCKVARLEQAAYKRGVEDGLYIRRGGEEKR
jgi:hypothetical protein